MIAWSGSLLAQWIPFIIINKFSPESSVWDIQAYIERYFMLCVVFVMLYSV